MFRADIVHEDCRVSIGLQVFSYKQNDAMYKTLVKTYMLDKRFDFLALSPALYVRV